MSKNITWLGQSWTGVPSIALPQTGGGIASFFDVSNITAVEADVAQGKIFIKADGTYSTGTASGGGGGATIKTTTASTTSNATSITFTNLTAKPSAFFVQVEQNLSLGSTRYVVSVSYDGTNTMGTYGYYSSQTRQVYYSGSYFSFTYTAGTGTSGNTLQVKTSSSTNGGNFRSGYTYRLIYIY